MIILENLRNILWGTPTIILLVGVGVYFTVTSGFMQICKFNIVMKHTLFGCFKKDETSGVSSLQAVTTALAGTMGTGNIAGIATALIAGGPGAVFWMWVSSFFGMMTKYAEVYLAVKYRKHRHKNSYYGGPMLYLENGLGSKTFACIFAICCAVASLGIGNATQIHSAAAALETSFDIPPITTGVIAAFITGLVIMGGINRIGKVTEKVIPYISIFYIAGGAIVLFINRQYIFDSIQLIFRSAFTPSAGFGGVGGYTVATAMRTGVARGVFSNEAGLGSSPMAHASAATNSPETQGYFGIFEVFVDTIVVCTFTALILLSNPTMLNSGLDGAALTTAVFTAALGNIGGYIVSISLAIFSVATLFCWAYYGECAVSYLTNHCNWLVLLYRLMFILVIVIAPTINLAVIWVSADIFNSLMVIPNLLALVFLAKEVRYHKKR